ncbi:MAG: hypothetical protein CMC05_05665 [Flavobacteriaceae bacterium]|jgi:hypothetical protein|nr:hypothetical protein [Flavobacteriaceae bacterium]MBD09194.1 hypothetical protein [Flavobacteriaceae bacterium]|tara:strand:- start:1184 stop:1585 length:402 start_codon:yes stop_codon:yes gene_type:complete
MRYNPILKNIAGFSLLITFLLIFSCANHHTSEESQEYIKAPKVGDIYFIEPEEKVFTLIKISSIDNDSIVFTLNRSNYDLNREIDATLNTVKFIKTASLNQTNSWSDSSKTYTKSELIDLYNDKYIYEIKRGL